PPVGIPIAERLDVEPVSALLPKAVLLVDQADDPAVGHRQPRELLQVARHRGALAALEPAAQVGLDQTTEAEQLLLVVERLALGERGPVALQRHVVALAADLLESPNFAVHPVQV